MFRSGQQVSFHSKNLCFLTVQACCAKELTPEVRRLAANKHQLNCILSFVYRGGGRWGGNGVVFSISLDPTSSFGECGEGGKSDECVHGGCDRQ